MIWKGKLNTDGIKKQKENNVIVPERFTRVLTLDVNREGNNGDRLLSVVHYVPRFGNFEWTVLHSVWRMQSLGHECCCNNKEIIK